MKKLCETIKDLSPEELAEIVKPILQIAELSQAHIFSQFPTDAKEVEWPRDDERTLVKTEDRWCRPKSEQR